MATLITDLECLICGCEPEPKQIVLYVSRAFMSEYFRNKVKRASNGKPKGIICAECTKHLPTPLRL